jgi:hypothetical protein
MYGSVVREVLAARFGGAFDRAAAAATWGEHLADAGPTRLLELREEDRRRVFNLGYYTWVEQQGVSSEDFTARRAQSFWRGLRALLPAWDERIREFNARTAARPAR